MDAFIVSYDIIYDKSKVIYYTFIQRFFFFFFGVVDLILKASGLDLEQLDFP